jgi:hypothetical protein
MSSQNKVAWTYTDEMGRDWRRAADKAITDQLDDATVKVGGAAAGATVIRVPTWIKPRVALVQSAGGVKRRCVAYEAGAYILTAGSTITLETAGADVTFTTYGSEGERSRNGIMQSS